VVIPDNMFADVVARIKTAYEARADAATRINVSAEHANIYNDIYTPMFKILDMPVGVSLLDVPDYPAFTRKPLFPAILATAVKWQHDRAREKREAHYAAWQEDSAVFTNISDYCRPLEAVWPKMVDPDETGEPDETGATDEAGETGKAWRVRARRKYEYCHNDECGCVEYNLIIAAVRQLQEHFTASDRMHTLLQSCVVGGHLCTRLVQYVATAADIRNQLRGADSGRAYIIFGRATRTDTPPEEFPARVKNDVTGADYVLVSFLSRVSQNDHTTYTNMARRENVDNMTANRTPSAMVADKNTYYADTGWCGFADTYGSAAHGGALLARASMLLYRRDDTLPSMVVV
jgi:hypothetical protein